MISRICAVPRRKCFLIALTVVFLAFALSGVLENYYDSDTHFILATGEYIIENGLPDTNPFTLHEGLKMPVHQWLYDVLLYSVNHAFGTPGLLALALLFFCILAVSVYFYVGCFTDDKLLNCTVTSGFLLWVRPWLSLRPTFLTMSILALLQFLFRKYRSTRKVYWLIPTVFLSLLEVNLHTSMWIMTIVMAMPHIVPRNLPKKGEWKQWHDAYWEETMELLLCVILMFAVGFLNPYGLDGMQYPLVSYKIVTEGLTIAELTAPEIFSDCGLKILAVIVAALLALRGKKLRELDLRELSLLFGTLFLAGMHVRNSWFLAIGATPVLMLLLSRRNEIYAWFTAKTSELPEDSTVSEIETSQSVEPSEPESCSAQAELAAEDLQDYEEESSGSLEELAKAEAAAKKAARKERTRQLVFRLEILVFAVVLIVVAVSQTDVALGGPVYFTPEGAADYLDSLEDRDITLYTGFNNGAYMELRGYKAYIDARPEIYSAVWNETKDVLSEYTAVFNGTIDYDAFLEYYDFTHMLVYERSLMIYMLTRDDYEIVWYDGYNFLFEKIN